MYKWFLNTPNILCNFHIGFNDNLSTSLALIEIVDNILKDLEEGKLVAELFLDHSKAFDTIDHDILLDKLQHYGIRGQPYDWFRSYLDNRQQFTMWSQLGMCKSCGVWLKYTEMYGLICVRVPRKCKSCRGWLRYMEMCV